MSHTGRNRPDRRGTGSSRTIRPALSIISSVALSVALIALMRYASRTPFSGFCPVKPVEPIPELRLLLSVMAISLRTGNRYAVSARLASASFSSGPRSSRMYTPRPCVPSTRSFQLSWICMSHTGTPGIPALSWVQCTPLSTVKKAPNSVPTNSRFGCRKCSRMTCTEPPSGRSPAIDVHVRP